MGIQAAFDKQALDMLPFLKQLYTQADDFERNQIICSILQMLPRTSSKPLNETSEQELAEYQLRFIRYWIQCDWLCGMRKCPKYQDEYVCSCNELRNE